MASQLGSTITLSGSLLTSLESNSTLLFALLALLTVLPALTRVTKMYLFVSFFDQCLFIHRGEAESSCLTNQFVSAMPSQVPGTQKAIHEQVLSE